MKNKECFGYEWANIDVYPILKEFAKNNRNNPTPSETILWNALRKELKPFRFRRQHIIGDFIVNFICMENHLIIEVDGAYHSEPKQANEDLLRSDFLKRQGFKVIRFTNEDVDNNLCTVINKI